MAGPEKSDFPPQALTKYQQADHYRRLAEEYLRLATRTYEAKLRDQYLSMAAKWQTMADMLKPTPDQPGEPMEE